MEKNCEIKFKNYTENVIITQTKNLYSTSPKT